MIAMLVEGMSRLDWVIVIAAWSLIPVMFILKAIIGPHKGKDY